MNRIVIACIFFVSTVMAFADATVETSGDASSNELQKEIDDGDESPNKASKTIEEGNFDASDGGLYCPHNQCEGDPDDVANGF